MTLAPITLGCCAAVQSIGGERLVFVYSCATDPIITRLFFMASLVLYLISRLDPYFVVHEVES